MDDIADRMRAAAAYPPPTSIDIDRLIAGEQRRRRQLRWAASAGGVAAAVAAVVFAATTLPGRGGEPALSGWPGNAGLPTPSRCAPLMPSPTGPLPPEQSYGTVRPRPTEPVSEAVSRLTAALDDAFRTQLPDLRVTPVEPGCERPQFQYHPQYKRFFASAFLSDSKGRGWLYLVLAPTATERRPACVPVQNGGTCEDRDLPGGGTARIETFPVDGGKQYQVDIDRPDGTTAHVVTNNLHYGSAEAVPSATRSEPILTPDQMIRLGSTPDLTLYP
jgi:hypothetical protein